jgi:large subunit ribosomal protein L37e
MSRGTPAFGRHQTITHIRCRRCGRHSYHISHEKCGACGFGKSPSLYKQAWKWKPVNRAARRTIKPGHKPAVGIHTKPRMGKKPRKAIYGKK